MVKYFILIRQDVDCFEDPNCKYMENMHKF